MKELQELKDLLENKISEIGILQNGAKKIEQEMDDFEMETGDYTDEYDDFIDEISGMVTVLGMEYYASTVLQEVDPIAYRCGLSDYVGSLDRTESIEYKEMEENLENTIYEIQELEEEIEQLEEEINELLEEND